MLYASTTKYCYRYGYIMPQGHTANGQFMSIHPTAAVIAMPDNELWNSQLVLYDSVNIDNIVGCQDLSLSHWGVYKESREVL